MTAPYDPNQPGQQPHYPAAPPAAGGNPQQGMPPVGGGELGQLNRPKDIDTSVRLWIGAMVLNVLGTVVDLFLPNDAARQAARTGLIRRGQPVDDATLDALINATKITALVVTLIIVGLWLLFVLQMRKAKNWARILLTIVGALSVLLTLVNVGSASTVAAIVSIVVSLLVIAAIVFMFRPAANSYFNASKRAG